MNNIKSEIGDSVFADAKRVEISTDGFGLLQWNFNSRGSAKYSALMPDDAIEQLLAWRDESSETKQR